MERLTFSNNDVGREVIAFSYRVADCKFTAPVIADTVRLQLALPLGLTITMFAVVVFRGNDDASLIGLQVRDNVAPSLVVVNTQSDDEIFAGVGHETKGATCPAGFHLEHMGSVNFAPDTGGTEFPASLLDDVEECACIVLIDPNGDCVSHSDKRCICTSGSLRCRHAMSQIRSRLWKQWRKYIQVGSEKSGAAEKRSVGCRFIRFA
jgi:hypothetical protein